LDHKKVIIIPTGALESHGNHLGVSVDIEIAVLFSKQIVKKFDSILFPPLYFGPCETLLSFPGTVTISEETYCDLLKDIISSIVHHSFYNICFINGHGGNTDCLKQVIENTNMQNEKLNIHYINWFEIPYIEELKEKNNSYKGDHGDRLETEIMMLAKPSSVFLDEAIDDFPEWPIGSDELTDYSEIMKYSVEGFPSYSSKRSGYLHFDKILDYLIKRFKNFYE